MAAAVAPISGGDGGRNRRGSGGTGGLDCATQFGGKTGAANIAVKADVAQDKVRMQRKVRLDEMRCGLRVRRGELLQTD